MAGSFTCSNALRRTLVLNSTTVNGIDFLEVLDSEAVSLGITPQTTLLIHFLKAAPALTAENFQITGGVRITSINCLWAHPATSVPTPPAIAAEAAYYAGLADASKVIVVRTNAAGDFSTYMLQIVNSADDSSIPTGLDPRLSSVDFSFKVECPTDFDCQPATVPPPLPASTPPPIDYLAKDYDSFRSLMLDRMAVTIPAWQERNASDLGIALVEVLAFAADRLSYLQDAVATEAYLATARKRVSVRRHAVMLDYQVHDGVNARAWVFIELSSSVGTLLLPGPAVNAQGARIPGTPLLTRVATPPGALTVAQQASALAQGAIAFETLMDVKLQSAHNSINFYTWSDESCCLPAGATSATLLNPASAPLQLTAGDVIVFEEVLSPITGIAADADPSHRCVVRLQSVAYGTDPLDGTSIAEITWLQGDALPFPLCLVASVQGSSGPQSVNNVSVARGNMVLADCGITIPAEALSPTIVPEAGRYQPQLADTGLTFSTPCDATQPASASLVQTPATALPAISLAVGNSIWLPVLNLLESGPFDQVFVVETEDDGTATLRFGDGEAGELPQSGLAATYRIGNGTMGNVGQGALQCIGLPDGATTPVAGILSLRNPLQASGGIDPEETNQVRLYAPQAFRTQLRAVTPADYAQFAGQYAGVNKAVATLRWTGSWYTMFITVDPVAGATVDDAFKAGLRAYLEAFRLAGYDVEVEAPAHVPLDIAMTICVQPGYFRSNVEQALYSVFSSGTQANGQPGFFNPANFTFGQTVYLSQIVTAAMQVPGVLWVDTDTSAGAGNYFRLGDTHRPTAPPQANSPCRVLRSPSWPTTPTLPKTAASSS